MMSVEIFWMILGFALLIGEMFTTSFFLMWFGISALLTAFISWFWIDSFVVELLIFAVLSFVLVLTTRRFANRISGEPSRKIIQDDIIGKEAYVTETILADNSKGLVKVLGQEWRAVTELGQRIEKGANVKVIRLHGVKLTVEKLDE